MLLNFTNLFVRREKDVIADGDLIQANLKRWHAMKITPVHIPEIDVVARIIVGAKERLSAVATLTHVPWDMIGIIAYREAGLHYVNGRPKDMRWDLNIAQGDPWNARSRHEPKNRGPFHSWEEAAQDALVNCPPFAAKWKDWTIGGALTILEKYNGLGYARMGKASPYIWSYTDQYKIGKYDADGHYNPTLVDKEIGCAPLLARMYCLDNTISLGVPTLGH